MKGALKLSETFRGPTIKGGMEQSS